MNKKTVLSIGKRLLSKAFLTLTACTITLSGFSQTVSRNHYLGIGPMFQVPTSYPYELKNFSIKKMRDNFYYDTYWDGYASTATVFQNGYVDNHNNKIGKGLFYYGYFGGAYVSPGHMGYMSCNTYDPSTGASFTNQQVREIYDDPEYPDERSITILTDYNDENKNMIVAQVKDQNNRYGIKILEIESCSGDIIVDKVFSLTNYDIFVLDAVYNRHDNSIYLCGYFGDASVLLAKYFISTQSLSLTNYDWDQGSWYNDLDKAIHLKVLNNGANAGNVFVTGCNNFQIGSSNYGGSLAMIIDQNLSIVSKTTILDGTPYQANDLHEYSYDVEENQDGSFYLYSNKFYYTDTDPGHVNPVSKYTMITYLQPDLSTRFGTNRRVHMRPSWYTANDWAWGTQRLSNNILVGLQSKWNASSGCSSNGQRTPSSTNIMPFVAEVIPNWSGSSLSASINFWKIYSTKASTTSYFSLGGRLSSVSFPSKFATDNTTVTSDLVFIAPLWNNILPAGSPAYNLTYKVVRTTGAGDLDPGIYSCDQTYFDCQPDVYVKNIQYQTLQSNPTVFWQVNEGIGSSQRYSNLWVYDLLTCQEEGEYKPTLIDNTIANATPEIKVYPNPAHDHVSIETHNLPGEADVKIEIINVTGQKVQELYNGKGAGLRSTTKFSLNMAPGVYFVKITSGQNEITQQKLIIQ